MIVRPKVMGGEGRMDGCDCVVDTAPAGLEGGLGGSQEGGSVR